MSEVPAATGMPRLGGTAARPTQSASPAHPGWLSVSRRVEAQVRRTPVAVALSCGDRRLTYAELDRRANQVAHLIRQHGGGDGALVGVYMERAPELLVAMLGVLKSGSAYVPLDPAYPRARISAILDDTRVAVLLTQPGLAGRLPAGPAVLAVDGAWEALAGLPDTPVEAGVGPDDLSHVIYTSGSTGTPKGVMIRHGAVAALLDWAPRALGIGEGTAVLASTSVCFDVHVAESWVPLALGARIVLVPNALHLASLPEGERVEVASMVPSAAAELLRMGGIPESVRSMNLGGEPVRPELARALHALPGVERVLNLYGPTEDTTYSTCAALDAGAEGAVPVGRPVDGTEVRLLDPSGRPVAAGEPGEVFLAGAGLGRGYLRRPAATAERWLPDPFAGRPGARMYRVGDLGRLAPDGQLECLGRVDHQVKVRGYRVELGEVEEALRSHPAVEEAVATVREDVPGDRVLAGYVVPRPGASPAAAELRAFVGARLPEYMVPTALAVLDALPRLPNGKVDRRSLPPIAAGAGAERPYRAPSTPAEDTVCRVWEEVLGAGRVGVDDDFFELGGHSLRATQVVSRLREALGGSLSPFVLFELRTPAELARAAERAAAAAAAGDETPPLAPADRSLPAPLSFSQQAIWFFQALSPGMRSYNFQGAIEFAGRLDVPALERALGEIVRRHEIFRTEFREVDGVPRQVVRPPFAVRLPAEELRAHPEGSRAAVLQGILRTEFLKPFHLHQLPLVRWSLYRTGDDRWTLAVVEHHFVHDGWSFGLFLRELVALYSAFTEGRPSPLPEPEIQFGDYAVWQRAWADGPEAARQLAYWKRKLAGVPALELATDRPRPARMSFRGRSRRSRMDPALAAEVREFGRRHGATFYVALLAAFQALLHRYSGQADFAVGGGVANRNERLAEQLIGMIVNTVAIRADLDGDPTVAELVERVRRTVAEAYAHREIPFGEVVEAVQPERSLSRLPVYQVAFSFHDAPYPSFELPGARIEVTEALSNESAKFDLQVIAIPRGSMQEGADDDVTILWEYATDLFDEETVARMEAHYRTLLRAMVGNPDARVSELPLMEAGERETVVRGWNGTAAAYDALPVHRQFERRAAAAPGAPAVEGDGVALSYGELDAAANRIAHALLARGAGPEVRVAVCMPRSPALVAALLGTLKSGAAYLPLDPAHPDERIASTLADAGAAVLVTERGMEGRMAALGVPLLALDPRGGVPEDRPWHRPETEARPDGLAYAIYTSGSTGTPKGVMVEHRALANLAGWHAAAFGVGPADRATLVAGVGFDASTWEIWPYLAAGASLHVVPEELRTEAEPLAGWLAGRGITVAFLPTPLAEGVLPVRWPADTALRVLLAGGDRLRSRPAEGLPFALWNAYGPTENAVVSTAGPVDRAGDGLPDIGRPVGNTTAYVLDAGMRPVPARVACELYVGGAQVARGYLGRPALTAAAFLPDPFSAAPGARLYRTGDRVRFLHDGRVEFLGRTDRQLKVRGFRIEPGEVEAALRAHPAVADAAVAARAEGAGAARLVAWVRADGDDAALPAALRAWMRERLPEYMVPAAVAVVSALPLTANGKVDVDALPTPAGGEPSDGGGGEPRTPAEATLAALVAGLLGLPRVGVHDNFFALGGDSIQSMQLVGRAREAGLVLSTRQVFEHQTVAEMAAHAAAPDSSDAVLDELAALEGEELDELLYALGELEEGGAS